MPEAASQARVLPIPMTTSDQRSGQDDARFSLGEVGVRVDVSRHHADICGAEQLIAPSASRARLEGPLTAARAATPSGSNRAPVLVLARAGALDEESERHECAPKPEAHR